MYSYGALIGYGRLARSHFSMLTTFATCAEPNVLDEITPCNRPGRSIAYVVDCASAIVHFLKFHNEKLQFIATQLTE